MTAGPAPRTDHWTYVLYEKYPDLYLPILESRKEAGAVEAEAVAQVLQRAGIMEGRVLDLACGIGRHSIPLAKLGYEVVGYDLSEMFVERARSWAASQGLGRERVRFHQGDMRDAAARLMDAKEKDFRAIITLFSSLGAYGENEDSNVLAALLKVAAPGCLLMVETLNRDSVLRRFQSFGFQSISNDLRLMNSAKFNPAESTLEDEWRFYTELTDGSLKPELRLTITGRIYTLHELRAVATEAGWSYLGSYGNLLTRTPMTAESPSIVLLCQKT